MKPAETIRAWQDANPRVDHNVIQGTQEWHALRSGKYGASEAAAMMGVSPYTTRGELLRQKYTASTPDVDANLQKVFDKGHETEALARPIAEKLIGEELYPVVLSRRKLSASCDGLTMDDSIALEHKQYAQDLFAAVRAGILPDHHVPQCQQVLLVTGAERLLFACSDGTKEKFASVWVEPDYEYQAKLIAGWAQFESDLASYKPVESAPAVVGATVESFPVLTVQLSGAIIASNLVEYESEIIARIKAIKDDLQTDQDFADAEKMVKSLKEAKEAMGLSIKQARASVEDIDALFNTAERIAAELDAKRLWLDKLVKTRKESRRAEIVQYGQQGFAEHIGALNKRLGRRLLLDGSGTVKCPNFAAVISGKRNFQAMQDAVDSALANAKLEANAVADAVQINLQHFANIAEQYHGLFRDLDAQLFKPADDFALIVKYRIADHQAAEQKRLDDERARIRAEEEAKARVEAETKLRAEQAQAERYQREAAMQEIQGIQHQVMIAQIGRAGVRKGGTVEHIRETLAETEAWQIDAERFGALTSAAQAAKDKAVADIKALLDKVAPPAPTPAPLPPSVSTSPRNVVNMRAPRPTDAEIVMALRIKFSATHDEVITWLREMNLENVPVAA